MMKKKKKKKKREQPEQLAMYVTCAFVVQHDSFIKKKKRQNKTSQHSKQTGAGLWCDEGWGWRLHLSVKCALLSAGSLSSVRTPPPPPAASDLPESVWPTHPTSHDIRSVRSISLPPRRTFTLISLHHRLRRAHCVGFIYGAGPRGFSSTTHLDGGRGTHNSWMHKLRLSWQVMACMLYIITVLDGLGLGVHGNGAQSKKVSFHGYQKWSLSLH